MLVHTPGDCDGEGDTDTLTDVVGVGEMLGDAEEQAISSSSRSSGNCAKENKFIPN
jgi:hypothetical protein